MRLNSIACVFATIAMMSVGLLACAADIQDGGGGGGGDGSDRSGGGGKADEAGGDDALEPIDTPLPASNEVIVGLEHDGQTVDVVKGQNIVVRLGATVGFEWAPTEVDRTIGHPTRAFEPDPMYPDEGYSVLTWRTSSPLIRPGATHSFFLAYYGPEGITEQRFEFSANIVAPAR